jgi:hypothetical protein
MVHNNEDVFRTHVNSYLNWENSASYKKLWETVTGPINQQNLYVISKMMRSLLNK